MRKLGFLTLCTLLFGALFYVSVQTTPTASTAKTPPNDSGRSSASAPSTIQAPPVSLRMDRTLKQIPDSSVGRSASTQVESAEHFLTPYLSHSAAKKFALLAGALALGLFAARALRPAAAPVIHASEWREPALENTANQNLEELGLVRTDLREAQLLLDSNIASHADELVAVNDVLSSREVELNEARDRLTMHEQTIAELRDELTLVQQRYEALSLSQQDQIERYETEKHVKQEAHTADIGEYESEIETLKTEVNHTHQELDAKNTLLSEVKKGFDETIASKNDLELHFQDVKNQLAEKTQLVHVLEANNNSLSAQMAELQEHIEAAQVYKEELDELGQNFKALSDSRDAMVEQYDALDHNFTVAHKRALEADELEDDLKNLKQDFERVNASKDEYVAELGEMHNLFGQAQSRASLADELEDQVSQVVTDLESVAAARDSAEQQVAELTNSLLQVTEKFELVETTLSESEQLTESTQAELERIKDELDQRNEALRETQELFDSRQEALLVLQQNFDNLSREEQELRDEHTELTQTSEKFEAENKTLTASVEVLREDLAQMVHKFGEKNGVIDDLEEQLADERSNVSAQQTEIEALFITIDNEVEKFKELSATLEKAKETELRLQNWDNSLQTYRSDISDKNKLIDHLRDCVSESVSQSTAFEEQSRKLEEKLVTYVELQAELTATRNEYADVGETLNQQQRLVEQLAELGAQREEALVAQAESLNEIQAERQQWLDQLKLKTNTAAEFEAELLDQHDIFLTVEELIDSALAERGVDSGSSSSFEVSGDVNQANSILVRKSHALVDVLDKADVTNVELSTRQGALESQIEQSANHINELNSTHLDQSTAFDDQRNELQEQLNAAINEHQGLLAELEEIREARDLLGAQNQEKDAAVVQLEEQHQSQLETAELEHSAHLEQLASKHQAQLENVTQEHAAELSRTTEEMAKTTQEHEMAMSKSMEEHALSLADATKTHSNELAATLEEHAALLDKQQEEMQKRLAAATDEHQELLAELDEVRQQQEAAHSLSTDRATQIDKLTSDLTDAHLQLNDHAEKLALHQSSLDSAMQKVAEAEEVWADTDTALQASQTELKQKDYELDELRDLVKTIEQSSNNDRERFDQTKEELEQKSREADVATDALNVAREQSEAMSLLRNEAIAELTKQQNRYNDLEHSLNLALQEQRKENSKLRAELTAQKERATSPVPVLTQKISEGSTTRKNIPVLGQPVSGAIETNAPRIPVLKKPLDSGKS